MLASTGLGIVAMLVFLFFNMWSELNESERKKLDAINDVALGFVSDAYHKYQNKELSEQEAKLYAIARLDQIRYEGNEYIFVYRRDGMLIMDPSLPDEERFKVNYYDFKDPEGTPLFQHMNERTKDSKRATVTYVWELPDSLPMIENTLPAPKMSRVIVFEPWNWIIGTGVYMTHVTEKLWSGFWRLSGLFLLFSIPILVLFLIIYKRRLEISEQKQKIEEIDYQNAILEKRVMKRTEELSSALKHLEQAKDELVQSEKLSSLGTLVSGVAHELNTPIGNALTSSTVILEAENRFSEMVARKITRKDLDDFVRRVREGGQIIERNMSKAAELIVAFKQLAVDQTSAHRREFYLSEIVEEVNLSIRPTLRRSSCNLEIDVPEDLHLDSYPGPLSQVLINLISNAVIHAFKEDEDKSIRIVATNEPDGWISLSVIDEGYGIPPELQKQIFDPFYTTRLGQGGSGLGLHITFNIVTGILGGSIDVNSEPGKGSCFTAKIPTSSPCPNSCS
ncbi:hypothetical protein GCM10011357_22430 [Lacimicrobium alkaliphilum]|uniref:histidine kinase n=1 Tax=Lacimicrobium alkaliphilum TaxID=1526571 RepID=A0ABQ1RFZ6_9ALTE|nr:hypothetical protein GCM10011357_22430 [Lacimicrobium alkaliphilum]